MDTSFRIKLGSLANADLDDLFRRRTQLLSKASSFAVPASSKEKAAEHSFFDQQRTTQL
jgi:hypothetical protein